MSNTEYSSYPHGYNAGVLIKEVLGVDIIPRKVFWVGNNSVKLPGEKDANDSNKGTFYAPFATIDAAYNKTGNESSTDGANDVILVRPNHTLSIANATTLVMDKSNVHIIGLGTGEKRPIITFTTATTANIPISGANNTIANMVFKCNIASQVAMITTTATDVKIKNCEFREGSATGLNFITIGAADNDSDRCEVSNCKFYMPTAGNGDHCIEVLKDMLQLRFLDLEATGDFDEGVIAIPAGGNACLDLQIKRCTLRNTQTNIPAITINGTGCSGVIQDCLLITDTQSTALDNGSLATDNVRWADETDQVSSTPVLITLDSTSNPIGVDDADNAFSSSNVVANVDGSVLERLEALMDPLSGYNPRMGFGVTKVSNLADGAGTDNLFTVTGRVLITSLTGEVTTVVGTTTTMKLRDVTNSVDLCAATTITSDAVGTMYALTSISANILNGTGATPVIGSIPNITGAQQTDVAIVGDAQAALTIAHVLDAAGTGAVTWRLTYIPLIPGATVTAAA